MLAGPHPRSTFDCAQVDPEPAEGSLALRRSQPPPQCFGEPGRSLGEAPDSLSSRGPQALGVA